MSTGSWWRGGEKDQSRLQTLLAAYLVNRESEYGITAFMAQRIQISPSRFRVPDICVVLGAEPQEQIFTTPPFLCVEILSPDDRMSRIQSKIDDFLSFGYSTSGSSTRVPAAPRCTRGTASRKCGMACCGRRNRRSRCGWASCSVDRRALGTRFPDFTQALSTESVPPPMDPQPSSYEHRPVSKRTGVYAPRIRF